MIFIVNILIKRNEDIHIKKHENEVNKLKEQEIRHNNNINLEKEKFQQRAKDNQEKIMKKYVTFYWSKKGREEKKRKKFMNLNEKFEERVNKLEEIERAEEKKKKKLEKKLLSIETNQKLILDKEKRKYEDIKERRYQYFNTCRNNRINFEKELTEEAKCILDYQNEVLSRQNERDEKIRLKRENLKDKTIYNQMMFEKNLQPFYKRLERIKSESIIKKSKEQRRKIYRDLKRAEAEARRREEEESTKAKELRTKSGVTKRIRQELDRVSGKEAVAGLMTLAKLEGFDKEDTRTEEERRKYFLPWRSKCRACAFMRVFRALQEDGGQEEGQQDKKSV